MISAPQPAQSASATAVAQRLEAQFWAQKAQPQGPCCEWPRWKGGDPGDRWPTA